MKKYLIIFVIICNQLYGQVTYAPLTNHIQISGFPEDSPLSLRELATIDQKKGWGKIMYNSDNNQYEINTNLWIGDDKTTGTYFVINGSEKKRTEVLMRGWIWVRPPKQSGLRSDGRHRIMNRLTIGNEDNSNAKVRFRFNCQKHNQYGLTVSGGAIHLFNTSLETTDDKRWGTIYPDQTNGSNPVETRVKNCVIRNFSWQTPGFGATGVWDRTLDVVNPYSLSIIENTIFADGGTAVRRYETDVDICEIVCSEIWISPSMMVVGLTPS